MQPKDCWEESGVKMVMSAIYALAGGLVALILDWSIYTHLSAYIRVGLALEKKVTFSEIAINRGRLRTAMIGASGISGGLSLELGYPKFWLLSVAAFTVFHGFLYFHLKTER